MGVDRKSGRLESLGPVLVVIAEDGSDFSCGESGSFLFFTLLSLENGIG